MRIEIDGRTATAEQLAFPALVNYGHFTAMQVRDSRVRGLDLHLARLDAATRELFGTGLDAGLVRHRIRHTLDGTPDASVQVRVFQPADISIMVVVRDPVDMPSEPQRLKSVAYQRPVAHIKHVGGFGQAYFGKRAEQEGFDDALLTGPGGVISEGGITNIGFFASGAADHDGDHDGEIVVWPDAPSLAGITMQLLQRVLGTASTLRRVTLPDVPAYSGGFVCNSWGVAPVGRIDDMELPVDADRTAELVKLYEAVPRELI
jgi:branched-subunit amino acid aminotransferase/4-amino-4-deoxychorismate lyase